MICRPSSRGPPSPSSAPTPRPTSARVKRVVDPRSPESARQSANATSRAPPTARPRGFMLDLGVGAERRAVPSRAQVRSPPMERQGARIAGTRIATTPTRC